MDARNQLQKVALGVIVAIAVNKITPHVEEALDKLTSGEYKKRFEKNTEN